MERNRNSYYDIAKEELAVLEELSNSKVYNVVIVHCQQVCEKLIKSVAEQVISTKEYGYQHKVHRIYEKIQEILPGSLNLNVDDLMFVSEFYIDARYPGDSFVEVSKAHVERGFKVVADVVAEVDRWRRANGLPVYDIADYGDDLANLADNIG